MKQKTKKPKPVALTDSCVARIVRGPRADGLYYWSAIEKTDLGDRRLFSMWGQPSEVSAEFQRRRSEGTLQAKAPKLNHPSTVGQLLERWYLSSEDDPELSKHSITRRRSSRDLLVARLNHVPLNNFNFQEQDTFRKSFLAQYSEHSFNAVLQSLKQAWNWGHKNGWGPFSEIQIKRISDPESELEKYTPKSEELNLLTDHLMGPSWLKFCLNVCRHSGLRIGELPNITWKNINFITRQMEVSGKTGKRQIPISNKLLSVLQEWKEKNITPHQKTGSVWGVSAKTILSELNERISEACSEAKISHRITIHSVRRYFIRQMFKAGIHVKKSALICGHSIQTQLKIYSDFEEEDLKEAISELDRMED